MKQYCNSLQSEWIKTRRSTASWLVIIGAFFIPLIIVLMRLIKAGQMPAYYAAPRFWETTFTQNWQVMAFFLLPMGVILATSLITQLEYRNNTWKQLHATPQLFSTIFFAKLSVLILMLLQFFILFNAGIYLSAVIPSWLLKNVAMPEQLFPLRFYAENNTQFFIDCLPILAIQYLISLQFKNFLVPLGVGIGLLVMATFAVNWQYGYFIPYTYSLYSFLAMSAVNERPVLPVNIHLISLGYFVLAIITGYLLYSNKKDKC